MKTFVRIKDKVFEDSYKKYDETSNVLTKLLETFEDDTFQTVEDLLGYIYLLRDNVSSRYRPKYVRLRRMFKDKGLRLNQVAAYLGISPSSLSNSMNGERLFTEKEKDDIFRLLGLTYSSQLDRELFYDDDELDD